MGKLRQDKGWQLGWGSILGTQELLTLEGLLGLLNLAPALDTFHLPPFFCSGLLLAPLGNMTPHLLSLLLLKSLGPQTILQYPPGT